MHTHDGTAEDLLHEIPSESLQQLLCLVRCASRKPVLTRITSIDSYLASTSGRGSGDVFQLHGPPGSGKTHLLYFFLATCTMPASFGGWNKAAFVYDMDGQFSISRFREIVTYQLQECDSLLGSIIVENCLKSIHIFRPTSSDQLAVSLAHLSLYHSKHFPGLELGLIAIHSLDAFYWIDRYHAEHAQTSPGNPLHPKLAPILDKMQGLHRMFVLFTVWGLPRRSRWTPPSNDHEAIDPSFSKSGYHLHQISLQHNPLGSKQLERFSNLQILGHGEASSSDFKIGRSGVLFEPYATNR